mmetsp:Transcript_17152/g.25899  ORF Transcript_17152/g.25899 Transcript_17152/m.25899 type:complete len:92 (-) Transcript_17152:7-282(-)
MLKSSRGGYDFLNDGQQMVVATGNGKNDLTLHDSTIAAFFKRWPVYASQERSRGRSQIKLGPVCAGWLIELENTLRLHNKLVKSSATPSTR